MALYVGAAEPLATIEWDESRPAFNVQKLTDVENPVRRRFTKPHIYYLGAHTGCSCGFGYGEGEVATPDDVVEDVAGRASVASLQEYLLDAVQRVGEVELFACWEGDQGEPPEHHFDVTPDFFGGETFSLQEKAAFRVRKAPPNQPLQPTSSGRGGVE